MYYGIRTNYQYRGWIRKSKNILQNLIKILEKQVYIYGEGGYYNNTRRNHRRKNTTGFDPESPSDEKLHSLGGKFALLTIFTLVRDHCYSGFYPESVSNSKP